MLAGQLFFPGSELTPYRTHFRIFQRAGFLIERQTVSDYRPTLRAWFENLVANKEEAIRIAGVRNYNRHLLMFAVSWRFFDQADSTLFRFLLRKPKKATAK